MADGRKIRHLFFNLFAVARMHTDTKNDLQRRGAFGVFRLAERVLGAPIHSDAIPLSLDKFRRPASRRAACRGLSGQEIDDLDGIDAGSQRGEADQIPDQRHRPIPCLPLSGVNLYSAHGGSAPRN